MILANLHNLLQIAESGLLVTTLPEVCRHDNSTVCHDEADTRDTEAWLKADVEACIITQDLSVIGHGGFWGKA